MHLSPAVALWLTLAFIIFLFRRDIRQRRNVTGALWLPIIWLTLTGSRAVSQWVGIIFGIQMGAVNVEDGSPVDAVIFQLLIVIGVYVLYQRRVSLSEVARNNRWMTAFLVYCFLAIIWSDFPLVALKRWLKDLGLPIMVLVILTEPNLEEAIACVMMRCAYVILPISVLFIKYFPDLGRTYDTWSGQVANVGITTNKNALGLDLFILGTALFWYFLKVWRWEKGKQRRNELLLVAVFSYMLFWLLQMAQSSTSMVSVFIAATLMVFLSFSRINPRYITGYLFAVALLFIVGEGVFGLYSGFLHLLGKSPTLTGRTEIWQALLQVKIDPILGAGFESFWLGPRTQEINQFFPGLILNEAHNAYLDTYLNIGLAGLFLLIGLLVITYQRARRDLINGIEWGRFRAGFLVASVFYGWTEAAFRSIDPVFFVIFLIAMDYPRPEFATVAEPSETPVGAEMTLAVAKVRSPVANEQTSVVMN